MTNRSEVIRSGYLTKSPPEKAASVSQWRRRWFVLADSKMVYPLAARYVRLEYYGSESEAVSLCDPKGVINLKDCLQVCSREPIKGHKFVLDVCTTERVYHLAADTAREKQQWIQELCELLFKETNGAVHSLMEHDREQLRSQRHSEGSIHQPQRRSPCPPPVSMREVDSAVAAASRPLPPLPSQKKKKPPPPVQPYKVHKLKESQPINISCHYEVAMPTRNSPVVRSSPVMPQRELPRVPPQTNEAEYSVLEPDSEYSYLEETAVSGYDPHSQEYSHLETSSPSTSVRSALHHRKHAQQASSKPEDLEYVNLPDVPRPTTDAYGDDTYSHLRR